MKLTKVWMLLAAMCFSLSVFAQEAPKPPQKEHKTPEERAKAVTDRMKEKLALSDEQYQQVYDINLKAEKQLEELRKEREAMREEAKGEREAMREKMKAHHEAWKEVQKEREEAIRAELNEEQREKYDRWIEERKEIWQGKVRFDMYRIKRK